MSQTVTCISNDIATAITTLSPEQVKIAASIKDVVRKKRLDLDDATIDLMVCEYGLRAYPSLGSELATAKTMGISPKDWLMKRLTMDPLKMLDSDAKAAFVRCDRNINSLREAVDTLIAYPAAVKVFDLGGLQSELGRLQAAKDSLQRPVTITPAESGLPDSGAAIPAQH